jgi:type I restriction enzyme S subunit
VRFGLSASQLLQVQEVLAKYPNITEAVIFGSRAMGNYKEASDVDIALKGEVNASITQKVKAELEENTLLPFFFDLISYPSINNPELVQHIDRYGVSIYRAKWNASALGKVIELVGGGTPKTTVPEFWNGTIPWLSVVDFNSDNKYVYDAEKKITEQGLNNSSTKLLNTGDVIISARGTVGALAVLKKPMAFNQSCYGIRGIPELVDQDFLYYLVKDSIEEFKQYAYGGVFDTITRDTFDQISVLLPPLPKQQAIASVLSSLDDKIDLLHRQNKTLEGMAAALWRKMFVEETNEDWDEKSLLDVIELVGGGTPKTEIAEYWDGSIPWLSAKDVSANHGGFVFSTEKNITEAGVKNSSVSILPKYSTVVSARGTVGKYCMLSGQMAFSQSNYGIRPRIGESFFFTHLLIVHVMEELKMAAYGSVFDTITTNTFKDQLVKVPDDTEVLSFEKKIAPYFEKMFANTEQIIGLSNQRKLLLPKLISGEVAVKV